jgi:hypothetical protein
LLTSGLEGASRTSERDVIRIARRKQVSIYPVYAMTRERSLFELLARQTGGALFRLRKGKGGSDKPGALVFDTVRGHYVVTIAGNLSVGERMKVEVKGGSKVMASILPLE